MLVHLNCIKHCSSIHDYLFIAVKTSLHYGGACMYKFCRFIPNFKYSMWLNLYLNVITFIFYCNTYVVAFIFQCVYVFQVSTSLALYGALEIPSKILHGAVAMKRYASALTHLGISISTSGLGFLLLLLWTRMEAFYICSLICG